MSLVRKLLVVLMGIGIGVAVAYRFRSELLLDWLPVIGGGEALEELTKDELYERAKAAEIPGRSDMTKDELIRALRAAT